LLVLAALGAHCPAAAQSVPAAVRLSAAPEVVLADGESTSTIRADVRDASGLPVKGFPVSFQTTLGTILGPKGQTAETSDDGIAEVLLLSTTTAGQATVTAVAGTATARVTVEFVTQLVGTTDQISAVEVRADWIAYYPSEEILEAVDHVRLTYRGIEITSDFSLLLHVSRLDFSALEVTVKSGDRHLEGYRLEGRLTHTSIDATMLQVGERVQAISFQGLGLTVYDQPPPEEVPAPLRAPDPSLKAFWISARSVLIFPQERIAFRQAEFWSGASQIMSMPNYVLHLGPSGFYRDQFLSLSSLGGVGVDFPLYYRVDRVGNGALRVQRTRREDWFAGRQGWSLALEEEYRPNKSIEGRVLIDGITRDDWGAQWSHHQVIEEGKEAYLYVGYPSHQYFYLNGNLYQYDRRRAGALSAAVNYSQPVGGSPFYSLDTTVRTFSRRLPKSRWMYYASTSLGLSNDVVRGGHVASQAINLGLFPESLPLTKATRGNLRSDLNFRWDTAGRSVTTVRLRPSIDHRLGRGGQLSLGYQWEFVEGDSYRAGTHQQWSAYALFWDPSSPLHGALTSSYDPEYDSLSASGDVTWVIVPQWGLNLLTSYQKVSSFDQSDYQFSLLYRLGAQDAALRWSSVRHRFWVEVVAAQF